MADQLTAWEPRHVEQVRRLVEEHRRIRGEPLLLAVYYAPERDPDDIFVFEVVENFGSNSIDPDRELFEVSYGSTPGFPLNPGQHLRLVLTNPIELARAVPESWPLMEEVRTALRDGRAQVIWSDPDRPDVLGVLRDRS